MTNKSHANNGNRHHKRGVCAISGAELPLRDLVPLSTLRTEVIERIRKDHPDLAEDALIARAEVARFRSLYVEELLLAEHGELSQLDRQVSESIARHDLIARNIEESYVDRRTFGEKLSDRITGFGGSWMFLILFAMALAVWITINSKFGADRSFDPYPFILLNLLLSCLAAVQAPIILMSQNRAAERDRLRSENDYRVNLKAELEIRHLHEKLDHLIARQWERLAEIQKLQIDMMQDNLRPRE